MLLYMGILFIFYSMTKRKKRLWKNNYLFTPFTYIVYYCYFFLRLEILFHSSNLYIIEHILFAIYFKYKIIGLVYGV